MGPGEQEVGEEQDPGRAARDTGIDPLLDVRSMLLAKGDFDDRVAGQRLDHFGDSVQGVVGLGDTGSVSHQQNCRAHVYGYSFG